MISVLTPTGGRPEAFAACVEMMRAQDYQGEVCWVIVDDGPDPMPPVAIPGWHVMQLRPEPLWAPGQNTLARNLLHGLRFCPNKTVIVEDDDEYQPWWIRACAERLDHHDLIGESHSLYLHRETGWSREMCNARHASLCSTALKGPALIALKAACKDGALGIDIRLWRSFDGSKRLYLPEPRGVTGVKGWPGRPGIGIGHRL